MDQVPVAILAGGLATRLGTITQTLPKSMVDVNGEPFIQHQLALLRQQGARKVVLCLGHLGKQVEHYIKAHPINGLECNFSYDGDRLLGTGGALRQAARHLNDVFWVLYGDSYIDIDYASVLNRFNEKQPLGLMTVMRNQNQWDRSNVTFRDGKLIRYDKKNHDSQMHYIDYGLSLLTRQGLEHIPEGHPYDLASLYEKLVRDGQMIGWEATQRFHEIGSVSGLEQTRAYLKMTKKHGGEKVAYSNTYLAETVEIIKRLDVEAIERMADALASLRDRGGRLFLLGVGGSAANASHAVNDFRKIARIESYAPTDNVSELTARVNDESWETVFVNWLQGSRLTNRDMVFVLSVGGGNLEKNISPNLVRAVEYAKATGATVCGIVGRDGGFTARVADVCVVVPTVNPATVTPHAESFQAVVWHLLVSHPRLQANMTKWEGVAA